MAVRSRKTDKEYAAEFAKAVEHSIERGALKLIEITHTLRWTDKMHDNRTRDLSQAFSHAISSMRNSIHPGSFGEQELAAIECAKPALLIDVYGR